MDSFDLDSSDAGESGWTIYLDHSSSVPLERKQEHDEDSSMVSDASSGPPNYCQETVPEDLLQQKHWSENKIKNKKKIHEEQGYVERFNSCLDDTACSLPVGEEVSIHKQHEYQYQRLDEFSQSYSTRRIFKFQEKFNSSFLQQAFPVEKLRWIVKGPVTRGRGEDKNDV